MWFREQEKPDRALVARVLHEPSQSNGWKGWCGREDSNFHGVSPTATSTLRVYQFRHDRKGRRDA
jgi:hypothetical protein